MRRTHRPLAIAAAVLIVSGCGATTADPGGAAHDDHRPAAAVAVADPHATSSPPVPGARTVDVEASSFAYSPAAIEVVAGETVNVRLAATDVTHDLTIDDVGFHVAADTEATRDAGLRIDRAGTYVAYCSVPGHREAGMQFEIVVSS